MKKQTPHKKRKALSLRKHVKRHVKMTLVPHKANQYRPHLIRRYGITAMLVAVIALQTGYNFVTSGSVLGDRADISASALLADTNDERAKDNLPPLVVSSELSKAAALKAKNMFDEQYWAHNAPDGTTPWHWFQAVGYDYSYAGENLAKNFASADAVTTAWMASPKHRQNILDTHYSEVGFAVVDGQLNGKPTALVVALYGSKDTTPATAVAGVTTEAPTGGISPVTRFGVALQSITPAMLGSVVLLLFAAMIALAAHAYRRKLPAPMRRSWRYHHGLYKAVGLTSLAIVIVGLYSGGQI